MRRACILYVVPVGGCGEVHNRILVELARTKITKSGTAHASSMCLKSALLAMRYRCCGKCFRLSRLNGAYETGARWEIQPLKMANLEIHDMTKRTRANSTSSNGSGAMKGLFSFAPAISSSLHNRGGSRPESSSPLGVGETQFGRLPTSDRRRLHATKSHARARMLLRAIGQACWRKNPSPGYIGRDRLAACRCGQGVILQGLYGVPAAGA